MQSVHAGAVQTHFFDFNLDSEMFQEHISQTSKTPPKSNSTWRSFATFLQTFSWTGFRKIFWTICCRSGAKMGAEWASGLGTFVTC